MGSEEEREGKGDEKNRMKEKEKKKGKRREIKDYKCRLHGGNLIMTKQATIHRGREGSTLSRKCDIVLGPQCRCRSQRFISLGQI